MIIDPTFDNPPTTGIGPAEAEEIKTRYHELLNSAKRVETWPSGYVRYVEFASIEDCKEAGELSRRYFLTGPVVPSQIERALRAIAGLE